MNDEHELVQELANNLYFRQTDYVRNEGGTMVRTNATSPKEDLGAIAFRTIPHNNRWLYQSPRLCSLGQDAFDHAPAVIREIHHYLRAILNVREEAGALDLD